MQKQHSGKSSNFSLMFIVYDELTWKEIRENSPEDIYSDFYKEKGNKIKKTREKLRKLWKKIGILISIALMAIRERFVCSRIGLHENRGSCTFFKTKIDFYRVKVSGLVLVLLLFKSMFECV